MAINFGSNVIILKLMCLLNAYFQVHVLLPKSQFHDYKNI